jgi:hypothetical protein
MEPLGRRLHEADQDQKTGDDQGCAGDDAQNSGFLSTNARAADDRRRSSGKATRKAGLPEKPDAALNRE